MFSLQVSPRNCPAQPMPVSSLLSTGKMLGRLGGGGCTDSCEQVTVLYSTQYTALAWCRVISTLGELSARGYTGPGRPSL